MTARQVWEGMLTELSKVKASPLLLTDFNYYFNKAINQYVNKQYAQVDLNQQMFDDLRVLKASTILDVDMVTSKEGLYSDVSSYGQGYAQIFGSTYQVILPTDYFHMLNCICIYKLSKDWKCYDSGNYVQFAAKPLTSDAWSTILNDYYQRPTPERPYYYIINTNQYEKISTNPVADSEAASESAGDTPGTDMNGHYSVKVVQDSEGYTTGESGTSNFSRTITLNDGTTIDAVDRETAYRYGNRSQVICQIRYGYDNSVFRLDKVLVDYIKVPQYIRLTQEQVNLTEDTSQMMEFPDYVCQEIINELTMLVMERDSDPRLGSNITVSRSVDNPAVQQQAQQAAQRAAAAQRQG